MPDAFVLDLDMPDVWAGGPVSGQRRKVQRYRGGRKPHFRRISGCEWRGWVLAGGGALVRLLPRYIEALLRYLAGRRMLLRLGFGASMLMSNQKQPSAVQMHVMLRALAHCMRDHHYLHHFYCPYMHAVFI